MRIAAGALLLALAFGEALGQEKLADGRVVRFDEATSSLTLLAGGKERALRLTPETKCDAGKNATISVRTARLCLRKGLDVQFAASADALASLRFDGMPHADTSKLKPLAELGAGTYEGKPGGLYPDGKNERPEAHEKTGLALAGEIAPLDADGRPSKGGKIALLAVGMSNCTQEFTAFQALAARDAQLEPALVLVDGAQGGMTGARIWDPESVDGRNYWTTTDARLAAAKVARAQVQVVWFKEADGWPTTPFVEYADTLSKETGDIVRHLARLFPNLKLAYFSCRSYGGYASTPLNPEPYAYESGFAVKWLVERQIAGAAELSCDASKGPRRAPWLSWGPYLWANGTTANAEGLSYDATDFGPDGTHPSAEGKKKIAERILRFFKTDRTTKSWFLR